MATTLLVVKNRAKSKLAAAITSGATSLTVTAGDGALFPSTYPFHLTIDDEIVSCTNRSTDTLTIVRAQQSTSAVAHANKTYVALHITAKSITDLNTAVNTVEGYFTDGFTMPTNKKIMFRAAGNYIHSDTAGDLMVNATTNLNLAIGGTDKVRLTATALSPATSNGNALGTTALMWADLFLASGGVINFNNGNVTITHDNSTASLTLTGKQNFGGVTDWGAGATGTVIDGSGYDWVTQTIGRVNANLNSTAAAAAYHAMSITANQTSSNSIFGTWTELYVSNSVDLTGADNFAAIWGQFEAGTGVTLSDTGCFTAGVYANVKAGATLTVPAGHSLNGFRAQLEVAAITNNGNTAAFECLKKTGTVDWEYGLLLADTATGIYIGTCTTAALVIAAGKVTQGFALTATTGGEEAFKMTITDAATQTSGMNRAFVVDLTVSGAKSSTAHSEAASIDLTLSGNTNTAYGMGIWITDSGGADHSLTEGLNIYLEDMGAGTLGAIVGLDIGINSTNLATGRHTALRMRNHSGTAKTGILFEAGFTTGIDLGGITGGGVAGLYTRGIDFTGSTCSVAEIDLDFGKIIFDQDGDTDIHCDVDDELDFKLSGSNFLIMAAGVVRPGTTNEVDLGTSSKQFKDLYVDGVAYIDAMAAFTLVGTLTLGGQAFDAGSGSALINTTSTAGAGLTIVATTAASASGVNLKLQSTATTPAIDDILGAIWAIGQNSNSEIVSYGFFRYLINNPADGVEDSKFDIYLYNTGALNQVLTVSGAGLCWADVGFNADEYYQVAGTQVVAARGAAVADCDAGTVVAQLNTLLARLRTHGLIAT